MSWLIITTQYSVKLCSVQTCLLCFNEEKQARLDNYWIRDQDEEKSWWILKMKMLSQFIKWSFKLWITELYRFHNYCWRIILRAFILLIINYGTNTCIALFRLDSIWCWGLFRVDTFWCWLLPKMFGKKVLLMGKIQFFRIVLMFSVVT